MSNWFHSKLDLDVFNGFVCAVFVPFSLTFLAAQVNEDLREPAVIRWILISCRLVWDWNLWPDRSVRPMLCRWANRPKSVDNTRFSQRNQPIKQANFGLPSNIHLTTRRLSEFSQFFDWFPGWFRAIGRATGLVISNGYRKSHVDGIRHTVTKIYNFPECGFMQPRLMGRNVCNCSGISSNSKLQNGPSRRRFVIAWNPLSGSDPLWVDRLANLAH